MTKEDFQYKIEKAKNLLSFRQLQFASLSDEERNERVEDYKLIVNSLEGASYQYTQIQLTDFTNQPLMAISEQAILTIGLLQNHDNIIANRRAMSSILGSLSMHCCQADYLGDFYDPKCWGYGKIQYGKWRCNVCTVEPRGTNKKGKYEALKQFELHYEAEHEERPLFSKYQYEIDPVVGTDPNVIYVKQTDYQPPPFLYSTQQIQQTKAKKRSSVKVGKDEPLTKKQRSAESNVTRPIPAGPSSSSLEPQAVQFVDDEMQQSSQNIDTFVLPTFHIPRTVVYSHYTPIKYVEGGEDDFPNYAL